MRGETLGRKALGLDAAYCALGGLVAVAAARPLASLFGVPAVLVALLGAGALAWSAVLVVLTRRDRWRGPVAVVAAANVAAAACFAALATSAPGLAARLLLAAVAAEVLAFAGAQVVALRDR